MLYKTPSEYSAAVGTSMGPISATNTPPVGTSPWRPSVNNQTFPSASPT